MVFWSFFAISVFCELGEKISGQFDELDEAIYQSDWYEFPTKVQRVLPIIMMTTQQTTVPCGYGNLPCIRESFQRVTTSFLR